MRISFKLLAIYSFIIYPVLLIWEKWILIFFFGDKIVNEWPEIENWFEKSELQMDGAADSWQ